MKTTEVLNLSVESEPILCEVILSGPYGQSVVLRQLLHLTVNKMGSSAIAPHATSSMNSSEFQKRHFAVLREKYQIGQLGKYKSFESDSFLYFILRKADLDIPITDVELQWLKENRLFKTIEAIFFKQYQKEENKRLETECFQLKTKYHVPENVEFAVSSSIYSLLWKVEHGYSVSDLELELLNAHGLEETWALIQDLLNFKQLKVRYQATQHSGQFPEEPLYSILKKLDVKAPLSDSEADWLLNSNFEATLELYWQQENEKAAELEFLELKAKYRVTSHPDCTISSPLYPILRKIKAKQHLDSHECIWLQQENLIQLFEIDRNRKARETFEKLKSKYKVTQYQSSDPSSPLFVILGKLELSQAKRLASYAEWKSLLDNPEYAVSEQDIQWLIEAELTETVQIAQHIHFELLKAKYQMVGRLPIQPFYEIMLKLEREERLDPKQVIQLIEEDRLSPHGKIAIAYHRLEAIFYEQEYKQTGNQWSLPSASSHWRKAEQPKKALQITEI